MSEGIQWPEGVLTLMFTERVKRTGASLDHDGTKPVKKPSGFVAPRGRRLKNKEIWQKKHPICGDSAQQRSSYLLITSLSQSSCCCCCCCCCCCACWKMIGCCLQMNSRWTHVRVGHSQRMLKNWRSVVVRWLWTRADSLRQKCRQWKVQCDFNFLMWSGWKYAL